ncbi:hypothetical protein OXX69_004563 [Metschnikowia pulcherrima]
MSSTYRPKNDQGSETSTHLLFMSKIERAHDEQGIMNLGKNCTFCNRLDFLPFHCEFCKGTFCAAHRTLEVHKCIGRPQKKASSIGSDKSQNGPTAASLFPDREKRQKALEASLKSADLGNSNTNSTPMMKLTKFLHLQKLKRESKKSMAIFGRSANKTPSLTAEIAQIKKFAKGPNSVSIQDRIYFWVLFVNRNEADMDKISVEKERKGVWVSKQWSVGRALDSIAETLSIINKNNNTQQSEERLNLFKVEKDVPALLGASTKISGTIMNGATLYLVKGPM